MRAAEATLTPEEECGLRMIVDEAEVAGARVPQAYETIYVPFVVWPTGFGADSD